MDNRIVNLTNGKRLKPTQALRAIDACAVVWVEENVSVRSLNLAESIAARNNQAKMREPLPYAEIHGVKYEPSVSGVDAHKAGYELILEASRFAQVLATA